MEKIVKSGTPPRAGKGRPKGVPNKVTGHFREVIDRLIADNQENFSGWLSEVAKRDPGRALELVAKLAEFTVPKLSRQEVSAELSAAPGGPMVIEICAGQAVLDALARKHAAPPPVEIVAIPNVGLPR